MARDNCLATHLRNVLFGLEVGTGHSIIFVCLKGSQRNYHSKNCIALLRGLCCLQKWDFSPGWQSHTNPLCKSSFSNETNYGKSNLVLFYPLSHSKTEFFLPLCISDAALSVLIKNTRAHVFVPTCAYGRTWVQVLEPHAHASAAKVVLSFYLAGYDKDKL